MFSFHILSFVSFHFSIVTGLLEHNLEFLFSIFNLMGILIVLVNFFVLFFSLRI